MQDQRHPCIDCGQPCGRQATRCRPCFRRYWETHRKRNYCVDCGKEISSYTHAQRCNPCSSKKKPVVKGSAHYHWKGGRSKTSSGYILVYQPDHPRITPRHCYIFEHILVWEQAHGKPLPKGWVIHHLNGIKHDNRSQNLVALPNKKHYLVLQAKAKRIQELEALLKNQYQLL